MTQLSGPTVPWWADDDVPGKQVGDFAGAPGRGFAKVLEGRINEQGPVVRPVLFIDAEGVAEDSTLLATAIDVTDYEFEVPPDAQTGDVIEVEARLLYRRAWRALVVTKGWTETPQGGAIEIEVANQQAQIVLSQSGSVLTIPALAPFGLGALALLLAGAALAKLRAGSRDEKGRASAKR